MNKYILYFIQIIGVGMLFYGVKFVIEDIILIGFVLFLTGLIINDMTVVRIHGRKEN